MKNTLHEYYTALQLKLPPAIEYTCAACAPDVHRSGSHGGVHGAGLCASLRSALAAVKLPARPRGACCHAEPPRLAAEWLDKSPLLAPAPAAPAAGAARIHGGVDGVANACGPRDAGGVDGAAGLGAWPTWARERAPRPRAPASASALARAEPQAPSGEPRAARGLAAAAAAATGRPFDRALGVPRLRSSAEL